MKFSRLLLAAALAVFVAGLAYVSQEKEPAGSKMVEAADKFLASLKPEQKARAAFTFDDKERTNWHFIPLQDRAKKSTRKGLPLEEMSEAQQQAALALVAAGTSPEGNKKATTIMSLEAILRDLEKGGAMVRNPKWYFFSIFGQPAKIGKWGWRVEGHHLALNFVVENGKVVSSTPAFFGANPAKVKAGDRKGLQTLPEAENLARELAADLDEDQRKLAHVDKQFGEIKQGNADPGVGAPVGLPASKMTEKQRDKLMKLLRSYAQRMPADVAEAEMEQVRAGGEIHFAYAGELEPGKPHTYRVQGPRFVVEFLNVQADSANNPANHIHSAWRRIDGDFGVGK